MILCYEKKRKKFNFQLFFCDRAFANPSNPQAHRFVRHSVNIKLNNQTNKQFKQPQPYSQVALIAVLEPVQNTSRKRADKRTRLMVASVDLCREPMFEGNESLH